MTTANPSVFLVWGGTFRSNAHAWPQGREPTPSDIIPGTLEVHGPFPAAADAHRRWADQTRRSVDICAHRMIVVEVEDPAAWAMELLAWKMKHAGVGFTLQHQNDALWLAVLKGTAPPLPDRWCGMPLHLDETR